MNDSTEHTPDVLSVPAPANSLEYAEEVAHQYYGIQGKAHEIICERDQLLMLQDTQGQRYFLRFINPAEPPRVSDFQTKALLHVAEADPGATGAEDGANSQRRNGRCRTSGRRAHLYHTTDYLRAGNDYIKTTGTFP